MKYLAVCKYSELSEVAQLRAFSQWEENASASESPAEFLSNHLFTKKGGIIPDIQISDLVWIDVDHFTAFPSI